MPLNAQELNEMAALAAELGDVDAELEAREALEQLSSIEAVTAEQQQAIPEGDIAEELVEQPQDFSLAETVKNIPGSAVQLGKDIIQPILHPIDTAESLQSLGQGLIEKALPDEINGVNFGQTENEEMVDAVGQFINERYGSLDALKSTIQSDPVGVIADVAGLFAGGSTLLPKTGKLGAIGKSVEAIGKAIDPINVTVSSAKALSKTGKIISPAIPEKLLESALKFRPSIKPAQRANMTKTALKEGIMPTVKGLRKITDKLDVLDTELNKIIDSATDSGTLIPKRAVFAKLKQLRQDLGGAKLDASADLKVVDRMAKQFDENLKRLKKDKLTPRELQELKTDAYKRINFDVTTGKAGFAKNEARKAIAKQAKESLEAIDPNVKKLNRKMGDLLELNNELERVVTRLDNRNLISLDTGVKIAAGASTGTAAGTGAGVAASVLGAPRVKARTAMALDNIRRNAETVDLINNKLPPVLARTMMEQAGRLDETLREHVDKEQ